MTYIIAEIGQNHNGSLKTAKALIDMATQTVVEDGKRYQGIDAIKLTIRDLSAEMDPKLGASSYVNINSFGKTYNLHRKHLELQPNEIFDLYEYTKSKKIDFILTLCQYSLVDNYAWLCDKIKVASRDLDNIPLLKALAKVDKEKIISTGMIHKIKDISKALEILGPNTSILYCVSMYPTKYEHLNLNSIKYFKEVFKDKIKQVGFSDHTLGSHIAPLAVAKGASIVEKHITLDKTMKGTDHCIAADWSDLKNLIIALREYDDMVQKPYSITPSNVNYKLGRSLAYKYDLKEGHTLKEDDIHMVSPGNGLKWDCLDFILGKKLRKKVVKNLLIDIKDLK